MDIIITNARVANIRLAINETKACTSLTCSMITKGHVMGGGFPGQVHA